MTELAKKSYEIYNIETYAESHGSFIKNNKIVVDDIKTLCKMLKKKNGYHYRIHKNTQYIFFGDLDNYTKPIDQFIKILQDFLNKYYGLKFTSKDFKYTQNNKKTNSYHYSLPKWNASTEKLKEIHEF
jgi:hypothetical protein